MARSQNRIADLVDQIDAISEACDLAGQAELADQLNIAAHEILEQLQEPAAPAAPAADPVVTSVQTEIAADTRELRALARTLKRSGTTEDAQMSAKLLRLADDMEQGLDEDLGIDLDAPSSLDDAAEAPAPAAEEPGMEAPAEEEGEDPECIQCPCSCHNKKEEVVTDDLSVSEENPSDEQVMAAIKVIQARVKAAGKIADAEEAPTSEPDAVDNALAREADSTDSESVLAEIDAVEAEIVEKKLSAKAGERRTPRAEPRESRSALTKLKATADARRKVMDVAKKLEAEGKSRLARRVRSMI